MKNRLLCTLIQLMLVSLGLYGCGSVSTSPKIDTTNNIVIDSTLPFTRLLISAEKGNAEAQYTLGSMYINGNRIPKNGKEAIRWYRKAAEQGYANAQYELGIAYEYGVVVLKNGKNAAEWYRKAANQGHVFAEYKMGVCYSLPIGVKRDNKEAIKWFQKSAEQGFHEAQYNLGVSYANGFGVQKNYKKALNWYHKAAQQGNVSAHTNIGFMYSQGFGVKQDIKQAIAWYQEAIKKGSASAQYNLGALYLNGNGVKNNNVKAKELFTKAAEQGDEYAQFSLGDMFYYGIGISQDEKEAIKWYRKAAKQGHQDAKLAIKLYESDNTNKPLAAIESYGIYERTENNIYYEVEPVSDEYRLIEQTIEIPAKLCVSFGFKFKINNLQNIENDQIKYIYRHPLMINYVDVKSNYSTIELPVMKDNYQLQTISYTFDHQGELLPGIWELIVEYHGKVLLRKRFQVSLIHIHNDKYKNIKC